MKEIYNEKAANWWRKKIQETEMRPVHGLDLFEKELSSKIRYLTGVNGNLVISTYNNSSRLLDEIALFSCLDANIPSGFEMKILLNNVWVYNSFGMLVANF